MASSSPTRVKPKTIKFGIYCFSTHSIKEKEPRLMAWNWNNMSEKTDVFIGRLVSVTCSTILKIKLSVLV